MSINTLKSAAIKVEQVTNAQGSSALLWRDRSKLPSTEQLLVEGGDARIALGENRAVNKYGCPPFPDAALAAFGSSTASVISESGFTAADRLRHKVSIALEAESPATIYSRELKWIRDELLRLCGVEDLAGLEAVFAASGTDIHLIMSQLAGGDDAVPTLAIMVDAVETGSCIPAALAGRNFSTRTALGNAATEGAAIDGGRTVEVVNLRLRLRDGSLRDAADMDAEVESWVSDAAATGRRVLLVLVDVSKTGIIAPSPACVSALQKRFPETLDVLVDACQFRIAPATLRAYLQHGFMVALTGSKFVTGPTFSGVLLFPAAAARRFREHTLPPALRAYSVRADWPQTWNAADKLDDIANFGLLLRWEAALQELRAFRAIPEAAVMRFLQSFANAVQNRLSTDPVFEPLPVPRLDRHPLIETASWDQIPTIFPFLIHHPATRGARKPLNREETMQIYRMLETDTPEHHDSLRIPFRTDIASLRCQLGQPVACGERDGVPVSALRLCSSARLVVEGTANGGREASTVIDRALAALDKITWLV